jgi:hypothetical protein
MIVPHLITTTKTSSRADDAPDHRHVDDLDLDEARAAEWRRWTYWVALDGRPMLLAEMVEDAEGGWSA